ncbi:MAG: type II secretion system F family protein [Chloroflexia bacterium]
MDVTPILLILLGGGMGMAAYYRVTSKEAWASLRGRIEALDRLQRAQVERARVMHLLPDFLGDLLLGYQARGQILEALEFAVAIGPARDPLRGEIAGALRRCRLAESKYPALHEAARNLGDPLLVDLFLLLEETEAGGGDIPAVLESYLEQAYERKATRLLEQAKVLPLQLLGITVPLLLPTLIIVVVAPFLASAIQAWQGR